MGRMTPEAPSSPDPGVAGGCRLEALFTPPLLAEERDSRTHFCCGRGGTAGQVALVIQEVQKPSESTRLARPI